jgi:predicted small integral membrane protein
MTQQLEKTGTQETLATDESHVQMAPSVAPPVQHAGRRGFLPIETNGFDRGFISVVCFIAIHLLWMRFVEAYLPLWIATILSLVLAVIIIRRG